jgi:hypothetical protein
MLAEPEENAIGLPESQGLRPLPANAGIGYAKRELDVLRAAGRIEFVGPSKTGMYQLLDG